MVLLSQGLSRSVRNLQPWRTQLEIVKHLSRRGWSVSLLSDTPVDGFHIKGADCEYVESWGASALGQRIDSLRPSAVLWAVAPTSVRHRDLLDILDCPVFPLLMSPAYSWRQILGVALRCAPHELQSLVLQQCIPTFLWRRFLMHGRIRSIYVTSKNSLERLLSMGIPSDRATILKIGLDNDLRAHARAPEVQREARQGTRFVYLGGAKKIRGFHMLLRAIEQLDKRQGADGIEFRLLARGAPDDLEKEVLAKVGNLGPKVTVVTGTLDRAEVLREIRHADAVLLPFLLAPSDVPIAVLEAMALGVPVVSTLIDGIPELLGGRGVLLKHRTSSQLTRTLLDLHKEPEARKRLGAAARDFASRYPTWDESLDSFTEHLEGRL